MDDTGFDDRNGREGGSTHGNSWGEFLRRSVDEGGGARDDERERDGESDGPQEDGLSGPGRTEPREPSARRVVVPPEADEFEGASRRRRRLVVGGIALLLALVGGYLVYEGIAGGEGAGPGAARVESSPEAPPPSAAVTDTPAADVPASVDEEREPTPPRSEPEATSRVGSERSSLFRARATTVDEALSRLRERLRDYRLGRIGCEGLARGLREMRAAFDRLEEVAGPDGEALRSADRGRYRSLVDDAGAAEGAFSGTGCSPSS